MSGDRKIAARPQWESHRQRELLIVHCARNDARAIRPRRTRIHGGLHSSLGPEKAIADDPKYNGNRDESGHACDHHEPAHSRNDTGSPRIERLFIVSDMS